MTALSVLGTPGVAHSFSPKSSGGKSSTQITQLGVFAISGGLREFIAKTAVIPANGSCFYGTQFHGSDYYASLYYGICNGEPTALDAFEKLSTRDVQYEALKLVVTPSDTRTMEWSYWQSLFGGTGSTRDIVYSGMIVGLGFSTIKDYYDNQTATVWPDHNSSEKAFWLKVIADNI